MDNVSRIKMPDGYAVASFGPALHDSESRLDAKRRELPNPGEGSRSSHLVNGVLLVATGILGIASTATATIPIGTVGAAAAALELVGGAGSLSVGISKILDPNKSAELDRVTNFSQPVRSVVEQFVGYLGFSPKDISAFEILLGLRDLALAVNDREKLETTKALIEIVSSTRELQEELEKERTVKARIQDRNEGHEVEQQRSRSGQSEIIDHSLRNGSLNDSNRYDYQQNNIGSETRPSYA